MPKVDFDFGQVHIGLMDVLQPSLGTNKRHGVDFYTDSSGNMEKSSQVVIIECS